MRKTLMTGLAALSLAACGKGGSKVAADSTRDIGRAIGDTTYPLHDAPAVAVTPPPVTPPPATPPRSVPPPAAARTLTLRAGTQIDAVIDRTISSRTEQAGGTFTARVANDAKDSHGRIVVPAGSTVNLTITELQPSNDKGQADGKITVQVTSITVGGTNYPASAAIASMDHTLKGRGVGSTEVLKTGAGTVLGGVAGRVIGGNSKGTVIGAVVGTAAGAVIAAQTANRDVVVAAGTPLVISLNGPLTIKVR